MSEQISYRDSLLTRMLSGSLSRGRVLMLVNATLDQASLLETRSSLHFGQEVRRVKINRG
jgi:hypothetical protein